MGNLRADYQPCFYVNIDEFDSMNYCILQCVVTSKRAPAQKEEGAVSGTDSESDSDFIAANTSGAGKTKADLTHVKWSPKLEATLEDILLRN